MTKENSKLSKAPKCSTCIHRGSVTGSCHSSCLHPKIKMISDDPLKELFATFASVGRLLPVMYGEKLLGVEANAHGIKKGWFNWPFNFDPIWLEKCEGYEIDK